VGFHYFIWDLNVNFGEFKYSLYELGSAILTRRRSMVRLVTRTLP